MCETIQICFSLTNQSTEKTLRQWIIGSLVGATPSKRVSEGRRSGLIEDSVFI